MPRLLALSTAAVLVLTALTGLASGAPASARPAQADATALLRKLPVRAESHAGSYDRELFHSWNDADRDGEDARAEVLKAESRTPATVTGSGTVTAGRWLSAYDGRVLKRAAQVEVDHVVALAEAWRSGAWDWSATKREAFGNDLGFGHSLIAVSKASNRAKSDHDPAAWVPSDPDAVCTYVKRYIAVKARWRLAVDAAERAALRTHLSDCGSRMVTRGAVPALRKLVERGAAADPVPPKPDAPAPSTAPAPAVPVAPAPAPSTAPSEPTGGSRLYRNCDAARAAGAAPVRSGDPGYGRHLDRDGDGVGCE